MRAVILVLLQTPIAILKGRFDVDKRGAIYGWPARVVGVLLLLAVVIMPLLTLFWLEEVAKAGGWETELDVTLVILFLGSVIVSALLCIVFREKRRDLSPSDYDPYDEDEKF
jgi:hypothetical protein